MQEKIVERDIQQTMFEEIKTILLELGKMFKTETDSSRIALLLYKGKDKYSVE